MEIAATKHFCHRPRKAIDYVPETNFSPIMPRRMRARQISRSGAADSPKKIIPRIATPAPPMPVHTAYPVPTGKDFNESESRTTLEIPVATVITAGINRVKP